MNTIARLFVGIGALGLLCTSVSAQTRPGSAVTAPVQRPQTQSPPARGPVQPATNLQARPPVRTAQNQQPLGQGPSAQTQAGQPQQMPQQPMQKLPPGGVPLGGPQGATSPQVGNPQNANPQNAAPPVAGQAPRAVVKGIAPKAPFTLTAQQQQLLDQVLANWEQQSNKVKNYKCTFTRWEVDETFGPKENDFVLSEGKGEIKFKAPDHGAYIVSDLLEWDKTKKNYGKRTESEGFDHWVCDGTAIYEFNAPNKKLIERQLAPEMRGKAISEGPLPFIFGAKADQLKRRYWLRDVTPKEHMAKQVWLEAWPKYQADAANYQHAVVVLNTSDYMPTALRIILPNGKNKQDYSFASTKVNDPLAILKSDFAKPKCPWGWTHEVIPFAGAEQAAPPGAEKPAEQAERPVTTQARRPSGTAVK